MSNFWTILEVMATLLSRSSQGEPAVDQLRRELLDMPEAKQAKIADNLNTVATGISELAKLKPEQFGVDT